MTVAATQLVGQVIDGKYRLGELIGETDHSAVFLAEARQPEVRKATIKLISADAVDANGQLGRWKQAAKLSHPNLIQILDMGRCELDGTPVLYVVMESADENLASVIAKRPIAAEEARDIVGPLVEALGYIHGKGFVHGHIKPANIMALDENLKISSDGLCRIGDSKGSLGKPSPYDSPEAAGGRISPAGDVWSLGMTLSEALTQRLPVWERTNQGDPAPPSTMPAEFLEIARHCLRRDPQLRWSIADIAARMPGSAAAPAKQIDAAQKPQNSLIVPNYAIPAVAAAVALIVVVVGAILLKHRSNVQEPQPVTVGQPAAQQQSQPEPENKPATPEPQSAPASPPVVQPAQNPLPPSAPKTTQTASKKQTPPPAPARPAATNQGGTNVTSQAGFVRGAVLHQVLPDAPQKARNTIQGKVRVSVNVHVDESGDVTEATFEAPGPSKYFADRVLQAAQLWKFRPAQMNGRNIPSDWILKFEIDPATIDVSPSEVPPTTAQ
ncbi:MAG: TonB family protein [Candidatus Acidiferrales bacterium]